ncbi:hypothetical protein HMPREF0987_00215 [Lachnospiraceae bacterium 9_1_43BFAA]|nr:hypothetical protein HMPREF0987_00215 [Lachnospiraceae bacterium 9_1_43BFAA]
MEHILNLEQVKKYYGGNSGNITKAVDGISMYVDKGEFVAIMGASGSGKTTLLNCISTIDTVTSGHITVNNQDITKIKDKDFADFRRENLGFIFQDFNLLDTLTIEENISLSLVINKQNPADIEKRVHAIADKLGIRDILSKFPYEVSGGQKQRCALRRLGVNDKSLFKTIKKQLLILFGIPVVYSVIASFCMLASLNNVYNVLLANEFIYVFYFAGGLAIFFFIYGIYWIATYIGFKRNINEES